MVMMGHIPAKLYGLVLKIEGQCPKREQIFVMQVLSDVLYIRPQEHHRLFTLDHRSTIDSLRTLRQMVDTYMDFDMVLGDCLPQIIATTVIESFIIYDSGMISLYDLIVGRG